MISKNRILRGDGRVHGCALLPLAALLAALPVAATAQQDTALQTITVTATPVNETPVAVSEAPQRDIRAARPASSGSAQLLRNLPGVSLSGAGGVSSLPSVHGLADDRLRIQVDGMDLISACGNHMNPPLSYIDPTRVGSVRLFAGITPVSVGGDSIGATIQVESAAPAFSAPGEPARVSGEAGAFWRSNGDAMGAHLAASYAREQFSLRYDGSTAQADNYKAARGFKNAGPAASDKPTQWLGSDEVGSSSYKTRNHALTMAWRGSTDLVELRLGLQDIPYQNYPNQRMDMTRNDSRQFNLRYQGQFGWGRLEARAYHEATRHAMNFGADKQYWYGAAANVPGMPMDTDGRTSGVQLRGDVELSERDTLRLGLLVQRYRLDDWWLPSGGGMAPDTFWNIRNGQRDRLEAFAEWEARWSPQWLTQVGLRVGQVRMDSGAVQGYNSGYAADANAFNARDRQRTDHNLDFTAMARYTANEQASYEFGFAHKTRSPNLYERYTWSTGGMAMRMINLVGDGNGYVGNPDLHPEVANTLSATADWHDATGERWGVKITPYVTRVNDYIGAERCSGGMGAMTSCTSANAGAAQGFVYLRFANQDVRLHGLDLSGFARLADSAAWGRFTLHGMLGYVRGKDRRSGDNLYAIMPLNARLALSHDKGGWSSTAELLMVGAKTHVSAVRNEVATAGYALVNLRTSYAWQAWRLDLGVDNVFNRFYHHPQGGAYLGQGRTMAGTAMPWGVSVPGMGRSLYLGATLRF